LDSSHNENAAEALRPPIDNLAVPLADGVEKNGGGAALEIPISELEIGASEKVAQFLEENTGLFEAVNASWQNVRDSQDVYVGQFNIFEEDKDVINRQNRRELAKMMQRVMNPKAQIGIMRYAASVLYDKFASKNDACGDIAVAAPALVTFVNEQKKIYMRESEKKFGLPDAEAESSKGLNPADKKDTVMSDEMISFVKDLCMASSDIVGANVRALFHQNRALHKINAFLQDDAVVEPFFAQMEAMIQTAASTGQHDVGLYELLATHIAQEGQGDNTLYAALKRVAPPYGAHAR
jgi:hypothetical protein